MSIIAWLLTSDFFAALFNGIVLWRLSERNGHSIEMRLLAFTMFASAAMTGFYLLASTFGTSVPRQFYPGWFPGAVMVGLVRSISLWTFALYVIFQSTARKKEKGVG